MANVTVTGLQELIDLTEKLGGEDAIVDVSKPVLKNYAAKIATDLRTEAPIDLRTPGKTKHGRQATKQYATVKKRGKVIQPVGLKSILSNPGESDFKRGLWFQQFKTDEPNFGWWTRFVERTRAKYSDAIVQDLKKEYQDFIDKHTI
ncbi:hypothetical protein J6A64_01220 [bacterium]|nr:hypothetical protein [bacterium]